jgi:phage baseplate assembly protein W
MPDPLKETRERHLGDESPIMLTNEGRLNKPRQKRHKQPVFAGVDYPLRKDGVLRIVVDEHAINSGLYQLMMTEPGERLMEPEFGTPIKQLIFDPLDEVIFQEISNRIARSIERWEKRIVIEQGVQVGQANIEDNEPIEHAIQVQFTWAFKDNVEEAYLFDAAITREVPTSEFETSRA